MTFGISVVLQTASATLKVCGVCASGSEKVPQQMREIKSSKGTKTCECVEACGWSRSTCGSCQLVAVRKYTA